jgi:hypothetical protein
MMVHPVKTNRNFPEGPGVVVLVAIGFVAAMLLCLLAAGLWWWRRRSRGYALLKKVDSDSGLYTLNRIR